MPDMRIVTLVVLIGVLAAFLPPSRRADAKTMWVVGAVAVLFVACGIAIESTSREFVFSHLPRLLVFDETLYPRGSAPVAYRLVAIGYTLLITTAVLIVRRLVAVGARRPSNPALESDARQEPPRAPQRER